VHPEGEVLHPRRLKSALVIVGCLALVLIVPITEPSLANIAAGAFFVCLGTYLRSAQAGRFVCVHHAEPAALLRVRFLYHDTYFPLGFGSFSSHTDHGRLFKTVIWKYDDSDRGGRSRTRGQHASEDGVADAVYIR
jgi:hypothetical protein